LFLKWACAHFKNNETLYGIRSQPEALPRRQKRPRSGRQRVVGPSEGWMRGRLRRSPTGRGRRNPSRLNKNKASPSNLFRRQTPKILKASKLRKKDSYACLLYGIITR